MYGLIGKIIANQGKRDELITILIDGTQDMPGCLSYIVAKDAAEADALWITEVWNSQDKHTESLNLPDVQEAIAKAKPLIAALGKRFETTPIGGQGLTDSPTAL